MSTELWYNKCSSGKVEAKVVFPHCDSASQFYVFEIYGTATPIQCYTLLTIESEQLASADWLQQYSSEA